MKAKELIGKKATRIAPAECCYGKDRSCMGDILTILNADDDLIIFTTKGEETRTLPSEFCDDNWKCLDDFIEVANENLDKIETANNPIYSLTKMLKK